MTTIDPAPRRLILSNQTQLERQANRHVKIVDEEGCIMAIIPKEDWAKVTYFFSDLCNAPPEAL
jgi:hypothetical protein